MGVLVCGKNSAPPTSAAASAASAGAVEAHDIGETGNLPRALGRARDEGWRVVGAAAETPGGEGIIQTVGEVEVRWGCWRELDVGRIIAGSFKSSNLQKLT